MGLLRRKFKMKDKDNNINDIQKAIIINRVAEFVTELIGKYPNEKITVSQTDYERNPFYGLNQLPSFISPFPDEYIYEIKFLKTFRISAAATVSFVISFIAVRIGEQNQRF